MMPVFQEQCSTRTLDSCASNLEEVVRRGAQPSDTTIVENIEGHVACLSTVDAATRVLWTFPLKSKHPPTAIIEKFLNRRGTKGPKRSIKTSPNGFLAQSQMFKHCLCQLNGFDHETSNDKDKAINLESIMTINLHPQQCTVRTMEEKKLLDQMPSVKIAVNARMMFKPLAWTHQAKTEKVSALTALSQQKQSASCVRLALACPFGAQQQSARHSCATKRTTGRST